VWKKLLWEGSKHGAEIGLYGQPQSEARPIKAVQPQQSRSWHLLCLEKSKVNIIGFRNTGMEVVGVHAFHILLCVSSHRGGGFTCGTVQKQVVEALQNHLKRNAAIDFYKGIQ
jgi:hypothetical protein